MSRAFRTIVILLSVIGVAGAAALYPVLARAEAWRGATWMYPWALVLIVLSPIVLYKMTLGADGRVPRLSLATIAPLLSGPRGWRTKLRDLPGILRAVAVFFAVLALARPQNVLRGEESGESGIDIVIVLDLSGSMRATMDAPPGTAPPPASRRGLRPTRLDTAKEVITDFVTRRRSDRIGAVVFGRAAFVLSPPTLDYTLLNKLVSGVTLDDIDGGGTAIGDAVATGVARLRRSSARSKAIILLTDGDSNAGKLAPEYASELAKTQGVRIYTVQIGNGDDVDVFTRVNIFGQPQYERKHFRVNPELLQRIASETGGEAFIATDKKGLDESMHTILDHLEKTRFLAQAATMEDLFPFVLFPAAFLVALEALVRLLLVRRFP